MPRVARTGPLGADMRYWAIGMALALGLSAGMGDSAQSTVGYDAYGRLICVYHATSTPKITTYKYDEACNRTQRTVVAADCQTCTSQPVGPPPNLLVQMSTNPAAEVNSEASANFLMTSLGSASDSATLARLSSTTSGGTGSCGSASVTGSQLNYTAPTLISVVATTTCLVNYVLSHPNGQQKSGRNTVTVIGQDPPGGGCEPGGGWRSLHPEPQDRLL